MDMISCFGYLSVLGISKLIHVFKYKTVHMIHSQISIRGRFAKATAKESKSKSKQQIHSNSNTTNATSTTANNNISNSSPDMVKRELLLPNPTDSCPET